jgi:hypothetical protein
MKIVQLDESEVLIEGDAIEYFEHSRRAPLYPFNIAYNAEFYEETLRDPKSAFQGGTYESLHLPPDMKLFLDTRARFESSNRLKGNINTIPGLVKRRQRRLSEHDGEWDMSRRWEVQPFYTAKRDSRLHRIVDIECYVNASAMVDANTINYYGASIWAINDILETHGLSTSMKVYCESVETDRNDSINVTVGVQLKHPGEYMNPANIARCLTSNFYRRIVFNWFMIGCDFVGKETSRGLGTPKRRATGIVFKDGKLIITANRLEDLQGIDLTKTLKEMLK